MVLPLLPIVRRAFVSPSCPLAAHIEAWPSESTDNSCPATVRCLCSLCCIQHHLLPSPAVVLQAAASPTHLQSFPSSLAHHTACLSYLCFFLHVPHFPPRSPRCSGAFSLYVQVSASSPMPTPQVFSKAPTCVLFFHFSGGPTLCNMSRSVRFSYMMTITEANHCLRRVHPASVWPFADRSSRRFDLEVCPCWASTLKSGARDLPSMPLLMGGLGLSASRSRWAAHRARWADSVGMI